MCGWQRAEPKAKTYIYCDSNGGVDHACASPWPVTNQEGHSATHQSEDLI